MWNHSERKCIICRQALFPKEFLTVVSEDEFIMFGNFLEAQGGGAGNGAGFINTKGRAEGMKGVETTWKELYDWLIESYKEIDNYIVIHTRIPSVGQKMDELCHPFVFNPNKEFKERKPAKNNDLDAYERQSRHCPTVLTFNGTWSKWKDLYYPLATAGYPLPWFGDDNLSDALIMGWSVFAMGVKILPAFTAGAAIILQPEYTALTVARDTVLKFCMYRDVPMYTSVIPDTEDVMMMRNVKKGVYCLNHSFVLNDIDLAEYTRYGSVKKWADTRHAWTSGKCDVCGENGSAKKIGGGLVCWKCRSNSDFDIVGFQKAHPPTDTEDNKSELKEYSDGSEVKDAPFVMPTRTPIIAKDTGEYESPFLEATTLSKARFSTSTMLDARFPKLRKTEDGQIVWWNRFETSYYLEKAEGAFTDTILVTVEINTLLHTLYHRPEWGALWADLEFGNFVVWDVLGVGEKVEDDISVYYMKKTDDGDETVGKLNASWKVFANPANVSVFDAWGLVYNFDGVIKWLERASQRPGQSSLGIDIACRWPKNISQDDKFLLEYYRLTPIQQLYLTADAFGVCEVCEQRQATQEYNDTEVCDVCAQRYGMTFSEGRVNA